MENSELCYTRTHLNSSAILGMWGYCDPSCRGREHQQDASYNLASKVHNDMWSENIFSLNAMSSGHCHTYNPENRSFATNDGGFYAMLGKLVKLCIDSALALNVRLNIK